MRIWDKNVTFQRCQRTALGGHNGFCPLCGSEGRFTELTKKNDRQINETRSYHYSIDLTGCGNDEQLRRPGSRLQDFLIPCHTGTAAEQRQRHHKVDPKSFFHLLGSTSVNQYETASNSYSSTVVNFGCHICQPPFVYQFSIFFFPESRKYTSYLIIHEECCTSIQWYVEHPLLIAVVAH